MTQSSANAGINLPVPVRPAQGPAGDAPLELETQRRLGCSHRGGPGAPQGGIRQGNHCVSFPEGLVYSVVVWASSRAPRTGDPRGRTHETAQTEGGGCPKSTIVVSPPSLYRITDGPLRWTRVPLTLESRRRFKRRGTESGSGNQSGYSACRVGGTRLAILRYPGSVAKGAKGPPGRNRTG